MDDELRKLAEAPLADPLKMYLPKGKAKAKRAGRRVVTTDLDPRRLTRKQLDERKENAKVEMLSAILDWYAQTEVPLSRMVLHTNLSADAVIRAMATRGRIISE